MARFPGAWEQGLYLNRQDFEPDSRSYLFYLTLSIVISTFHFTYRHSERFTIRDDRNANQPIYVHYP